MVWLIWDRTGALVSSAQDPRIFYVRNLLIGVLVVTALLLRPKGIWGEEKRVSAYGGRGPEGRRAAQPEPEEAPAAGTSAGDDVPSNDSD